MNVSDLEPFDPRRHRLYQLCANTQTAERLCEAINAVADVHNLYPWSVARMGNASDPQGVVLAVVGHRTWDLSEEEKGRASAYLQRAYPLHPGDIDLSRMTVRVDPYAGQDRYRRSLPGSRNRLREHQNVIVAGRTGKTPRKSRQDGPTRRDNGVLDLLMGDIDIEAL